MDDTVAPELLGPVPRARGGVRSGVRSFADRWPFRRKLNILVGVPVVVVLALLAYVISGLVGQAQHAASAARLVRDSRQVAELVDLVDTEHTQALLLSVRYESATSGARPSLTAYRQAQRAVDDQSNTVRAVFGSRLPADEAQVLRQINGFSSLRSTIEQSYLPADDIDPAYTAAAGELIDGLGLDQDGSLSTTTTGSLLDSLLRAESAHSTFETSVFSAQTGDANALIEYTNAVGSYQEYTSEAARFGRFSTEQQRAGLAGIEQGPTWNTISMQYAGLQIDPSSLESKDPDQIRDAFTRALQSYPDYRRLAQNRLKVTGALIDQIAHSADRASTRAWTRALLLLGVVLFGFVLWVVLTVAIRRSVIRPVQALTGAATQVAEVAGQELARVCDDDAADTGPPRLREVPVTAKDEIGDLAEAFNRVQTTAAALLERQVLSRRNVAEMFGNVGRRVSNLTARQLTLIDAVERGESDPGLLDRLYRIDHLAVRLQRNADSLMLLAGIRESGVETSPTPLTNVVRAALGQIEDYQRVSLAGDADVTVGPDIIADLTLMVAELLENAVSFSPAGSPVEVTLRASAEGALISVTDHGLGMTAERLAEENARLIRRERLDLVPTKVLGLFVVGSLARRWGVRVTLGRTPGGGVTGQVAVPSSLLLMPTAYGGRPQQAATAMAARHVPQRPALYQPAPYDQQHEQPYQQGYGQPYGAGYDQPYDPFRQPAPAPAVSAYDSAAYEPAQVPRAHRASAEPLPGAHRAPADPLPAGPSPARALTAAPGSANPLPRRIPRRTRSAPAAPAGPPAAAPTDGSEPAAPAPRTPSWAAPAEPEQPDYGSPAAGYPRQAREPYPDQVYRTPYEQPAPRQERYDGSYGAGPYDSGAFAPDGYGGGYGAGPRPVGGDDPAYRAEGRAPEAHAAGAPPAAAPYDTGAFRAAEPYGRTADRGRRSPGERPRTGGGPGIADVTPLRRRVRGATLRTTLGTEAPRTEAPRPVADAEEVRSELDEFEAAIERANRDTRTARTDEGAQQ